MLSSHITSSRKGFSILVALGTTWVLLVIVLGIASVYLSEMKLSRLHYDNILTYAQAEWAFEYAMLKIANHREGFSDSVTNADLDGKMLIGSTERTKNIETNYTIEAQSNSGTFSLVSKDHLILPLFIGDGFTLTPWTSKNPSSPWTVTQVSTLRISWAGENISWNIIAMSGSENVSIAGTGEINPSIIWIVRLRGISCYAADGSEMPIGTSTTEWVCPPPYNEEELTYFYDLTGSVDSFLKSKDTPFWSNSQTSRKMNITDPYLMIFNNWVNPEDITIETNTPFALPDITVTAESKKGNAMQSIRFYKDNSGYYDALKYGVYDTAPL